MKTKSNIGKGLILTLASVIIVISTAFNTASGQKGYVKLVYNFQAGKTITYNLSNAVSQTMDIEGQTINVFVNTDLGYKVKMVEKQDENLKLEITIDSMSSKTESMAGSTGGKLKEAEGKSFNMVISPLGKAVDLTEAAKLEFPVEGQGSVKLVNSFSNIFPTLPNKDIKTGDTWEKTDTISTDATGSKSTLIIKSTNKFEGVEKVNGTECAKIVSAITGTMQVNAQNMGMDIFMSGTLQGQGTLFFAVKEGYFVKQDITQKMNGTAEISGPQSMSFPIIIETTSKTVSK